MQFPDVATGQIHCLNDSIPKVRIWQTNPTPLNLKIKLHSNPKFMHGHGIQPFLIYNDQLYSTL